MRWPSPLTWINQLDRRETAATAGGLMVMGSDLAWRVERTCLNAWPALRQVLLGGWVLRFSGGLTRRANSANPLGVGALDPDRLIAGCEALYRHQRLPTIFRLPSIIDATIDVPPRGARIQRRGLVAGSSCRYRRLSGDARPRRAAAVAADAAMVRRNGAVAAPHKKAGRPLSPDRRPPRYSSCLRGPLGRERYCGTRLWRDSGRSDLLQIGGDGPEPAASRLCPPSG